MNDYYYYCYQMARAMAAKLASKMKSRHRDGLQTLGSLLLTIEEQMVDQCQICDDDCIGGKPLI
jgi:hypothetical protein